jgi:hypothetical protein
MSTPSKIPFPRVSGHGQGRQVFVKIQVSLRERLKDLKGPSAVVFLALALRINGDGIVWPSLQQIAEDCGMATRTVIRGINTLRCQGLVEVQSGKGRHVHSRYWPRYVSFGKSAISPVSPQSEEKVTDLSCFPEKGDRSVQEKVTDLSYGSRTNEEDLSDNAVALSAAHPGFQEWLDRINADSNKQAVLYGMFVALFPAWSWNGKGRKSPPEIPRIAVMMRKSDPGNLCRLIWKAAADRPCGDPLSYVQAMIGGGRCGNRITQEERVPNVYSDPPSYDDC